MWRLLKILLGTFAVLAFAKMTSNYLGVGVPNLGNVGGMEVSILIIAIFIGFVAGLTYGLIWGEENAAKRYRHLIDNIYWKK